jgi:hypothetical protein
VLVWGADVSFIGWGWALDAGIGSSEGIPKFFFVCTPIVEFYILKRSLLSNPISSMPGHFPCLHPGCHQTFSRLNSRTQHWNTQHRPLSPDSEPDAAHEFQFQYHPKLNGTFSLFLLKASCSRLI